MIPRIKTHYSLLQSTIKPDELVLRAKELGYDTLVLNDTHTVSGAVDFYKACKKEGVRPILGAEIAVANSDKSFYTISVLCRTHAGWLKLLKIISRSNAENSYTTHPCIDIEDLKGIVEPGDFIVIDGYVGSLLYEKMFEHPRDAYFAADYDSAAKYLQHQWIEYALAHVAQMRMIFGEENYILEIGSVGHYTQDIPLFTLTGNCVAEVANTTGCGTVIGDPVHYLENAVDHQLLLSVKMQTTMSGLEEAVSRNGNFRYRPFLQSSGFTLQQSLIKDEVLGECEEFDILDRPQLPHFKCPDNLSEIDYLRVLCRDGWKAKVRGTSIASDPAKVEEYRLRVEHELKIIEEANIAGYFLIVADIVNKFRQNYLIGSGRGSVGGSLVAYLINITLVDPIPYGLLFSRFYNSSRGKMGQLPDIDIDFPPHIRDNVISYIKDTYGHDRVCQMVTFGRLQGRSALQAVLKANDSASPGQVFLMTKKMPKEDKISDKLSEMDKPSVIMWTLENMPKLLSDFCHLDEDGKLQGEFAGDFEQAMRIEGTFKSQGIHAAGVVVASKPLDQACPMVKPTKGFDLVGGFEMGDLEAVGLVKLDILGLALLKKIQGVVDTINLTG